ncbi:MAG: alpha/beta hydrolase [Moraxellaceae bacterium]|nr:MAG: alpha/beta hydrolase [Moraxellaceae bacterium]
MHYSDNTKLLLKLLVSFSIAFVFCFSANAHEFKVHKDILWASPKNFPLTADIYVPQTGKKNYPVLVIYHGGGWLINTNAIMNSMSEYIASHSDIIVANMNYRVMPSNNNTTTMNEIVEDVFGGVLWVKDNIAHYGGDPKRVAVTGDSAGGHLTAMLLMSGRKLESDGFAGKTLGFNPTYLPAGNTAEKIAKKDGLKIQAAVISYGAFDLYETVKNGFETPSNFFWKFAKAEPRGLFGSNVNLDKNPDYYKAVSPIYNIPKRSQYKLPPQFVHVGSNDKLTTPELVKNYVDALKKAGQPVEHKVYTGPNHAFLDGGTNDDLGNKFERDAPQALDDIISFLNKVLK